MKLPKKQIGFLNKILKLDSQIIENTEENEKKNQRHKKSRLKTGSYFIVGLQGLEP